MSPDKKLSKYLLWCVNEHCEFRIPELKAIATSQNIKITWIEPPSNAPYVIVGFENELSAMELTSRSMLVKYCIKLLNSANSMVDLHTNIKKYSLDEIAPITNVGRTYRLCIETFNRKINLKEKTEKIESFSYLPLKGKVDLKNAECSFYLIEYYGLPDFEPVLQKVFFGRHICDGGRALVNAFSLKTRSFISNTTMDPLLSFIMANMAEITPGDVVIDPFVGSGSILVSAAHRGAYVWGWDIDYLTLHGLSKPTRISQKHRKPGENVRMNLIQYGLERQYLDVAIMDNSNIMWNTRPIIDAIITDPPYGIKKSSTKVKSKEIYGEVHPRHIPSKTSCNTADTFSYLLNFAAQNLKIGGRLIYWLPVCRNNYSDDNVPTHPCLKTLSNSEQVLSTFNSRRLIKVIKTRQPAEEDLAYTSKVCDASEFRDRLMMSNKLITPERSNQLPVQDNLEAV